MGLNNGGPRHGIRGNVLLPILAVVLAIVALAVTAYIMVLKPGRLHTRGAAQASSSLSGKAATITTVSGSGTGTANPSASVSSLNSTEITNADYYNNTLFIGDSITQGIKLYKLLDNVTILANNNMSISSAAGGKIKIDGSSVSIADTIVAKKPSKVFILIGSNDVSWMSQDTFISDYGKLIDLVAQKAPAKNIVVQSVFPVSAALQTKKPAYSNSKINAVNAALKNLCAQKGVVYADIASALKSKDGNLDSSLSNGGVNIKRKGYMIWLNALAAAK